MADARGGSNRLYDEHARNTATNWIADTYGIGYAPKLKSVRRRIAALAAREGRRGKEDQILRECVLRAVPKARRRVAKLDWLPATDRAIELHNGRRARPRRVLLAYELLAEVERELNRELGWERRGCADGGGSWPASAGSGKDPKLVGKIREARNGVRDGRCDPLGDLLAQEMCMEYAIAVADLGERERQVWGLDQAGHSPEEIAMEADSTTGSVYTALSRARKKIADAM